MNKRRCITAFLLTGLLFSTSLLTQLGCGESHDSKPLVLAATSDLEETGILEAWIEDFRSQSGIEVELLTAVDQEVLDMAQHGECDVLITHLPQVEERLERSNYVEYRQEIMYDQYIIVGPSADPASIRGVESFSDAFRAIAEAGAPFVLRVDESGTSYKEGLLWAASGITDFGDWMVRSEAGMGDTLRQASQQGAYTLSDQSVFKAISDELNLEIFLEIGGEFDNPYQVMLVSELAYPDTDTEGGLRFIEYLLSEGARSFFDLGAWEAPSGQ
jgi:tungstate transport system substrate-binding protein